MELTEKIWHIYTYTYIYIYTTHIHTHTHIYIHNGILFSHEEKDILPSGTIWKKLEDIMLK